MNCFIETGLEKMLKLRSAKKESLTSIGNAPFNLNNFCDGLSMAKRASRFIYDLCLWNEVLFLED